MPASNETRVRVEDFSKIIARVCPSSASAYVFGFALMSRESSKIAATSPAV
jgi:hypothetical protein